MRVFDVEISAVAYNPVIIPSHIADAASLPEF
jgi:hypothetical protein